jgi:hypothetical protein
MMRPGDSFCGLSRHVTDLHGAVTGICLRRERIRIDGKALEEETFARYFWEVWDCLKSTRVHLLDPLIMCNPGLILSLLLLLLLLLLDVE